MEKEETKRLLAEGPEEWNKWARTLLAERQELRRQGRWIDAEPEWNNETKSWHARATADLSEQTFGTPVDLSGLIFPGYTLFVGTKFRSDAQFHKTTFEGVALFSGAHFQKSASFEGATFVATPGFEATNFSRVAKFAGATFESGAEFPATNFSRGADFSRVEFEKNASFPGTKLLGRTIFDGAIFFDAVTFGNLRFHAYATFDGANFKGYVEFDNVTFAESTTFLRTKFEYETHFDGVVFDGEARFSNSTFEGGADAEICFTGSAFGRDVYFDDVGFSGPVSFSGAVFGRSAWFSNASFERDANFLQAEFKSFTTFDRSVFESVAIFRAINASSVFSLAATQFRVVPDFIQSHFTEAPRLDNSKIVLNRTNLLSQSRKGGRARHDPDLAARWRALKRLAIQGHDHAREQAFFKGELEARRWSEDKPWHGVFWLGLVYGLFSDFGRSISRPFFWWLASVAGFACFYLSQHPGIASGSIGLFSAVKGELGIGAESLPLECVSGAGSPVASAALLSLQKGLLVFGLVPLSKIAQLHLCLYGAYSPATLSAEAMSGAVSPSIPNFVTAVSFFQYSVSAILIFLVVLAVRNHFRIR